MLKKIIYYSSLSITTFLLSISIILNNTYSPFSSTNVKYTITMLSSSTFTGRLAGSDENSLAGEIIKKRFSDSGLKPLNGGYKEDFTTICPVVTNTSPYLKIFSDGTTEEELKYGVDFKEDMINFKNNTFSFSNKDEIKDYGSSTDINCADGKFLFYVPSNDNFSFRSSFMSDFPYDAIIMITANTHKKIIESLSSGKEISVHIPFSNKEKTISNIIGVIEGSNKNLPPLVITAHYDHLGKDGLGNNYSGALDNASGTAFIVELARSLATLGTPKRDIIFVALNAEEFGLLGSKYFAENNYFSIKNSEVMNFDMIGSASYPITFMQGLSFKGKDSELLSSLKELCEKSNVDYEVVYENSSDHSSFNDLGIDSVSFCHSDKSKIHTPNDTADFIDTDAIETVYKIVDSKIKDSCYSRFTLFFYNKSSIVLLSSLLILLMFFGIWKKEKSNILKSKINK